MNYQGKRKAQQVKDKKQTKRRILKNKHDDGVIELLKGMVSTMNLSYKKDRMTAAVAEDKNRWKDVSKKITQITAQNEKNLKVVAQLYQKAEGEGQSTAERDINKIVEDKGSLKIIKHQSAMLAKRARMEPTKDLDRM